MTQDEAKALSIVLLAKRPGRTSFASLYQVKKALGTRKVGHTGTLDSFATGLLVVCVGRMTKAVPYITQADKTYLAVIEFGCETDTLEWTGKALHTAPLPQLSALEKAVQRFTGDIMQTPPQFSAIHVGGRRASDIARSGGQAALTPRPVTVRSSALLDALMQDGKVKAALLSFTVSKGTYIRSLARDIALSCGSRGSLAALRRTQVGDFSLENAALFGTLQPFTIDAALAKDSNGQRTGEKALEISDEDARKEIIEAATPLTSALVKGCGLPASFLSVRR